MKELLLEIQRSPGPPQTILDENKPLRLKEAAAYLGIAETTLYGLVSRKKIKFLKPGKHLLFLKIVLDEYIHGGSDNLDPTAFLKNKKGSHK
ncbi:MAG: helix-turn-helix domain-containing protein [Saprospiraceae bacterium]|nr:helix-turn-helix domain-containing protein [Saprospiraceae bacterium]